MHAHTHTHARTHTRLCSACLTATPSTVRCSHTGLSKAAVSGCIHRLHVLRALALLFARQELDQRRHRRPRQWRLPSLTRRRRSRNLCCQCEADAPRGRQGRPASAAGALSRLALAAAPRDCAAAQLCAHGRRRVAASRRWRCSAHLVLVDAAARRRRRAAILGLGRGARRARVCRRACRRARLHRRQRRMAV